MKKINKKINITLIFMLIGVFFISDMSYALRPPLITGKFDYVVAHKFYIDVSKGLQEEEQLKRIIDFLYSCSGLLQRIELNVPEKVSERKIIEGYPKRIRIHFRRPNIKGSNAWHLFLFATNELYKNLRDYSNDKNPELRIERWEDRGMTVGIRIVSINKEKIENLMDILNGSRIRPLDDKGHHRGLCLIFLKEFALINNNIALIIDSNGNSLSFSKYGMIESASSFEGTMVQVIISIPYGMPGIDDLTKQPLSDL